jgi:hypothetical protein
MFYVFILPIKLFVTVCTGELFIIVVDCICYEYPSHHESYAVAPSPGHSFRPYTEKELPFPVPNEKCCYTPNSDLMSLYSIYFNAYLTGAFDIRRGK